MNDIVELLVLQFEFLFYVFFFIFCTPLTKNITFFVEISLIYIGCGCILYYSILQFLFYHFSFYSFSIFIFFCFFNCPFRLGIFFLLKILIIRSKFELDGSLKFMFKFSFMFAFNVCSKCQ